MTLRKDCNCACHTAPNAVIHVHPCCGPGSEGWPHVVLPNEDPYKALSLFGNDKETKLADTVLSGTNTVHIRGDGKVIQIEVFGYERPDAGDGDDANLLRARCSVTVAEFSAVVRLSFVTHDFVRFAGELEQAVQLLKGTATFSTAEAGFAVEVKFTTAGHADVFGSARSQTSFVPDQSVLSFSFETDQSFLAQSVRELKAIVRRFPVRNL